MGLKYVKTTHSTVLIHDVPYNNNKQKGDFLFHQPTYPSAIALKTSHTLTRAAAHPATVEIADVV